jgi:outer membrane immunogenic protein
MKRLLLAGLGLAAVLATPAFASDMPGRSLPPPRAPTFVPFFTWNGFYLGLNAGYGFGLSSWTNTVTQATTGNFDVKGGVFGGTIGYNVQFSTAVFGVEGDIAWSSIKGSSSPAGCAGPCETSNTWLGTARGRLGYAFDRFLPYVTAGAAFGEIKGTFGTGASFTDTKVGWTAGLGMEYAFLGNWSAKLEYLYVDLGKVTCTAACSGVTPIDVTFTSNIVRAGVNYKF